MKLSGKSPSLRWCWKQMDLFLPLTHIAENEMNRHICCIPPIKLPNYEALRWNKSAGKRQKMPKTYLNSTGCDYAMIAENIQKITAKIAEAAIKANRSPDTVKLVAVSKHFPAAVINEAYAAGQLIFGENYIQEVQLKREHVPSSAIFHFIGHLQSNKAKIAAATCNMIETVDGIKLGKALNNHLESLGKTMDVLVQVNIGNEVQKSGVKSSETAELLRNLNALPKLRVCGLMTMPPLVEDPEQSRPHFASLRLLSEKLMQEGLFPSIEKPELSMGMSSDFHIAIEEGATIVRVGTAIFGQR